MNRVALLSFLTILTSCNINSELGQEKKIFNEILLNFDKDLTSHFPKELSSSYIITTNIRPENFDSVKLYKYFFLSIKQAVNFDYQKNHFNSNSKYKYSSIDSNLLLVFPFHNEVIINGEKFNNIEPESKKYRAKRNLNLPNSLPVPLFDIDEYKSNTYCNLDSNFTLYVIDAVPREIVNCNQLNVSMPKKWQHGYSKGVAMNDKDKTIIYWISVW